MTKLDQAEHQNLLVHGAKQYAAVHIDTYNAELKDGEGFLGDRASNRAFRSILDQGRKRLREAEKIHWENSRPPN